jgi:hypothetical protein
MNEDDDLLRIIGFVLLFTMVPERISRFGLF